MTYRVSSITICNLVFDISLRHQCIYLQNQGLINNVYLEQEFLLLSINIRCKFSICYLLSGLTSTV